MNLKTVFFAIVPTIIFSMMTKSKIIPPGIGTTEKLILQLVVIPAVYYVFFLFLVKASEKLIDHLVDRWL